MSTATTTTLKSFNLRQTDCREEVLGILLEHSFALSHGDIEAQLTDKFDRVTVYRTLKTFLDKGLIHKVLDDEGTTKYALCRDNCHNSEHQHHHDHVHFKCTLCGHTTCLDDVRIPILDLPAGYQRVEINLLVQGICAACGR